MPTYLPVSLTARYRSILVAGIAVALLFSFWAWQRPATASNNPIQPPGTPNDDQSAHSYYASAVEVANSMRANPLDKSEFGQMGKRLQVVKEWIQYSETTPLAPNERENWSQLIESVTAMLVPFIQRPGSRDGKPVERLRTSFVPGSKGLVITTGKKRFRYACHLITNIRQVLGSQLPIQIAYSGDEDLPKNFRDFVTSVEPDVSTFDVTSVFDDQTLDLPHGGWAVKAFAILGSTFEQVMLLDADDVFLQRPDVIFNEHPKYLERGNLLFHDRLLWQGAFKERHAWWEKELAHTELSDTIRQSKVYMEGYAEEGDSGVVAVDKSRLDVFIGLLHIGWQNTKEVRDAFTYRQGYGDKESWWFGFELTGTPYSMEQHYAAIAGHVKINKNGSPENRVCSFTIAHVDHKTKLLWFNGSLLKNKEVDSVDFDVATEWMIDGTWEKGATKQDMSCMSGAQVQPIDENTVKILRDSVELAQKMDDNLREHIPEAVP
ncbi:uncharacterized protein Z518_05226 [Rhinocladiella mackenziei CBS 650.93]|uniref:Rhinocladiella mackenziei CBS 650.93 unplaced genomic scaffold supercont1.4, whole genome shotgun sequence n=1 Tax=Rhinocladiella mackenziei CBS 650.93 TaxID=1442369 RepID=A0A0D2H1M5_9EURO|nr:uncharacterized protein Z518_05226 [Rhinocladiella mackenziei CBS 650.93]KIX04358.1 hypothetical protein Z518_05226 [Rhinocladiella mackenziei CBS 650.93]